MTLIEFPVSRIKIASLHRDLKANRKMVLLSLAILLSNLTLNISLSLEERMFSMKAGPLVKNPRKSL